MLLVLEEVVGKNVGLFVTCLVDMFRPQTGFASLKLLKDAGCKVTIPQGQTCCGQPAFNSGDKNTSRDISRQVIEIFEQFDYVVAPSGSCAAMLKVHMPALFANDEQWRERAEQFSHKVHELTSFLHDICGYKGADTGFAGKITYHDSCSGLRELGVRKQPREMLKTIPGAEISEMKDSIACCGFGGTFCVKYPDISNKIVSDKVENIKATGAQTLLAGDMGCLMNMAGKLRREGHDINVRHVAEILAGMENEPPIAGE